MSRRRSRRLPLLERDRAALPREGCRRSGFRRWPTSSAALRTSASATPADQQPSIAVLPFANMSRDPDDEYFSDGLAEEIINALAQVPGLKVIARTSAFAFKGKEQDITTDRRSARRRTRARRQRPPGRQPDPRHGAADQRRGRQPPLVGALRPRADGRLRDPGRNRPGDRGRASSHADCQAGAGAAHARARRPTRRCSRGGITCSGTHRCRSRGPTTASSRRWPWIRSTRSRTRAWA